VDFQNNQTKMGLRLAVLALALSGVAAFVPSSVSRAPTQLAETKEDLIADAAGRNNAFLGASIGFWDPIGLSDFSFWGKGEEATVGFLRHAEIKHGRVAMAAFIGYIAQSTPFVSGEHTTLPYKGYIANLPPPAQWDNMPGIAKLQILVLIGALESYGEGAASNGAYQHYTKGGKPGYFPPIQGLRPEFVFDLYDPFKWFPEKTEAQLARGREVEINNGRLAQFGIFSFVSEATVPGSVPPLTGLIAPYSGNVMIPFEGDFSLNPFN